jgi:hypothetical protein
VQGKKTALSKKVSLRGIYIFNLSNTDDLFFPLSLFRT